MDLMLGVLDSESGSITLSGKRPRDAIRAWPGKIAYIPQHIGIKNGSIRDNVLFGLSHEVYGDREIEKALHIAAFEEVFEWDKKLDSVIGPGGIRLSGGQQQRLGIARALVTEPDLVFMDEATSSLDSSAEAKFLENWNQIRKGRTVVVIAHRLSTVKAAEQVAYLDHGKLVYVGSFEQVREAIPQFERQARLLGIS
jgi:ABC-type multidrug transport system fused ATPase/permease subunit